MPIQANFEKIMYGSEKREFFSFGGDFLSKLYHWLKILEDIQKSSVYLTST